MHKLFTSVLLFISFFASANTSLESMLKAQGKLLIDNQQKIIELQSEIDLLRGKIEEINYQLTQTNDRHSSFIKNFNETMDNKKLISFDKKTETLISWEPTGDDRKDYNFIIKFVLDKKELNESKIAFEKFLKKYPNSGYLSNVSYWLGQINYLQNKKEDAAYYFAKVAKDYPKSSKASESLYKIGLIILDKGQNDKAKTIFERIINEYQQDTSIVDMAKNKLENLQ